MPKNLPLDTTIYLTMAGYKDMVKFLIKEYLLLRFTRFNGAVNLNFPFEDKRNFKLTFIVDKNDPPPPKRT